MQKGWYRCFIVAAAVLSVVCLFQPHHALAVTVDLSDTVQRNHIIYFGDYGSHGESATHQIPQLDPDISGTRYVQLSNGSRFVCETTDFRHHDPPSPTGIPLNIAMQSVLNSIKDAGLPCTHAVEEDQSAVLCWDREVRLDTVSTHASRMLGRGDGAAQLREYTLGRDAFGPYAATVYANGDECLYTKQPTEAEVRFYCRYTEMENPVPFLTLEAASQCRYVMRVMSRKFCFIPQLDHAIETETVQCRMLD